MIKVLLVDQAEIWAESTPQVAEILYKAPDAARENVTTFQSLFSLQYPERVVESTSLNVYARIWKRVNNAEIFGGAYTIMEESKMLTEELATMEKPEQEQNVIEFPRRIVKDQISDEPISKLMKSYTGKNSLTLLPPNAHNTRICLSSFSPKNNLPNHRYHSPSLTS